jgi:hypothetical protein
VPDFLVVARLNLGLSGSFCYTSIERLLLLLVSNMSDLDRGIMKFKGADTPIAIGISAAIVIGGIVFLVVWAMQNAYVV